jgi:2'-5' RNA ligase
MPFAVVLFFDKSQSQPFDTVIEELAVKKVAPFMFEESVPHVTLAIYDDLNCSECKEKIEDFTSEHKKVTLVFSHVGLFKSKMNAVFAAPIVTESLLQFHRLFHNYFKDDGIGSWENYFPGKWIPHCTLAFNVADNKIDQAFSICRSLDFPLEICTTSIGIMEFEPVREIYRIPFEQ